MMLFWPPPPIRVVPVTPGATAEASEVAVGDGQVFDRVGGHRERRSPLCVDEGRLARDLDRLGQAADFDHESPTATRSPALTLMPVRLAVLKPVMLTWSV